MLVSWHFDKATLDKLYSYQVYTLFCVMQTKGMQTKGMQTGGSCSMVMNISVQCMFSALALVCSMVGQHLINKLH